MRLLKCFVMALAFVWGCGNASASQDEFAEYQVKALFLYNFANFVEWPREAFSSPSENISMCLYGEVPFGGFLDAVNGTLIGDRRLVLRRTQDIEDIKEGCHILFVGEDQKVRLPTFWNEIKYIYVLSIGEEKDFTDRGGIVNIMRTTDQVQFEINVSNALENGLFIGSDILSLAREIKRNKESDQEEP